MGKYSFYGYYHPYCWSFVDAVDLSNSSLVALPDTSNSQTPPNVFTFSNSPTELPTSNIPSHPSHTRAPLSYLFYYHSFATKVFDLHEPQTYQEASMHPKWCKAIQTKLQALEHTVTWELTTLSLGKSVVACRWIYKIKIIKSGPRLMVPLLAIKHVRWPEDTRKNMVLIMRRPLLLLLE